MLIAEDPVFNMLLTGKSANSDPLHRFLHRVSNGSKYAEFLLQVAVGTFLEYPNHQLRYIKATHRYALANNLTKQTTYKTNPNHKTTYSLHRRVIGGSLQLNACDCWGIVMREDKGKIYSDINRLPKVSYEATAEILVVLEEAAGEFPEISKFYVSGDRVGGGGFRYEQFVFAVQKWQKKWLGSAKRENR